MACQGFPPFLGTNYTNFLHFKRQYCSSVLYYKDSIDSIYDYLEASMAPTIFLTETLPTNTISHYISLSDFPILESTQTNQDKNNSPFSAAAVAWSTLSHQQLTMDPNIADLTRQYCDTCKHTDNLADSLW